MLTPQKVQTVLRILDKKFPHPKPTLNFKSPFEFLVAVVLAAQCTDVRVNKVTPNLFPHYNTPQKLLQLGEDRLRDIIHSTGYHRQKSKHLILCARALVEKHKSIVPKTMEELIALPGIGRKSASAILAQAYNIPAFPVDTHIFRVTNRLGLVHEKTPQKTEFALLKTIPKNRWIEFHMQLIAHGRTTCKAPRPKCGECPIKNICQWPGKKEQLAAKK
ncbi:MAG: endonuclease III [Candidatus Gracilibacteria bacterium]